MQILTSLDIIVAVVNPLQGKQLNRSALNQGFWFESVAIHLKYGVHNILTSHIIKLAELTNISNRRVTRNLQNKLASKYLYRLI
jgi:hypothetical protein